MILILRSGGSGIQRTTLSMAPSVEDDEGICSLTRDHSESEGHLAATVRDGETVSK